MGKKKRSQAKKGGSRKGWGLNGFFRFSLKVIPAALLIVAFGGVFIGVRDALYADPNLSVQKVEVLPADSLSAGQRQQLDTLLLGKNIITVNPRKISKWIEIDPGIQNARVVKYLPAKISVEVVRRKAVVCIQFSSQGNCGLVSEDGMILDVVPAKNVTSLLMEAFESGKREPQIGMRIDIHGFSQAVRFMKLYEEMEMSHFEPLTRIGVDHLGNVSMILGNGPQIRLGRRPQECLKALEKTVPLLKSEERSKIDYVDLQYDNVIVKRKR